MCVCVTCHVAVDQLWFDWSAAIHIDVKMSRRVAVVFVRLAGLFVHSWEENNENSFSMNHICINTNTTAGRLSTQELRGDEEYTLRRITGTAPYVCISTEPQSEDNHLKFYFCSIIP